MIYQMGKGFGEREFTLPAITDAGQFPYAFHGSSVTVIVQKHTTTSIGPLWLYRISTKYVDNFVDNLP